MSVSDVDTPSFCFHHLFICLYIQSFLIISAAVTPDLCPCNFTEFHTVWFSFLSLFMVLLLLYLEHSWQTQII